MTSCYPVFALFSSGVVLSPNKDQPSAILGGYVGMLESKTTLTIPGFEVSMIDKYTSMASSIAILHCLPSFRCYHAATVLRQ